MTKENKLVAIAKEQGVSKSDIQKLAEAFGAPFEEAGEVLANYKNIEVTDESQTDLMAEAREKRLTLKKARTTVENNRKELKADIVKQGKAIDSVARYVKEEIQPAEEYLELQEKFADIKREKEAEALKAERTEKLMQYTDDISVYNLDTMSQEQFETLHNNLKAQHEDRLKAEAEAEKKAKEEAEAERKRQAEIEKENQRLKAEAEKAEAERAKEREAERKKQEKLEAERQKELKAEREKREAIETEQRAKAEAERKAVAEAEEQERKALLAPDKDKILKFVEAIELIKTEKLPAVKTKQAQDLVNQIEDALAHLVARIKEEAKEL